MLAPLTGKQRKWVDDTLNKLSMEQLVGHLLCPESRNYSIRDWLDILAKVPLGCIFSCEKRLEENELLLRELQKASAVPLLVAADMEHGAIMFKKGVARFPDQMAVGAADDAELAYQMGRATAKESRCRGVHWTFSPVVDLNLNFQNPVTNHRSLGDNPDKTIPLFQAIVRGLQEDGLMAATVKHFPGDGVDDRDQHLCTSVNSLPKWQWEKLYGRVWRAAFDAGAMSVMAGHISYPDWQGFADSPADALPATLCESLQVGLLRRELGFEGLLVSDAAPMVGITSRVKAEEMALKNIVSGSDVFLFAEPVKDFERLMAAVKDGRLSEGRVREAARRVLEMKARLNLHVDPFGKQPSAVELKGFEASAQAMADKAATALRGPCRVPKKLAGKGKSVLTVTLTYVNKTRQSDLEVFDAELKERGYEVEHLLNPEHNVLMKRCGEVSMVFVNVLSVMHLRIGTTRLTGEAVMPFWRSFYANHDNVFFSAFGSPYLLHEQPHLPNLLALYSAESTAQRAAVKVWLGEIKPEGVCPVRLPQVKVKALDLD